MSMSGPIMEKHYPPDPGDGVLDLIIQYVSKRPPSSHDKGKVSDIVSLYFNAIVGQGFTERERDCCSGMRLSNVQREWEYDIQVRVVISEDDPKEPAVQSLLAW